MAATTPATDPPDALLAVTADAPTPARPTPAELVARAVAPVKPAFLCPPPVREAPKEEGKAAGGGAVVKVEKKSKRQLKRERQQVTTAVATQGACSAVSAFIGLCLLGAS
jgi:tRNA-dihydrouridine synthase 3